MQQQGPLGVRRRGEVPHLALEEVLVLWVHAQARVERHVHALGALRPLVELVVVEVEPRHETGVGLGELLAQAPGPPGGLAEVVLGHDVGEEVVVDHRRVLVGPGDPVQVEAAPFAATEPEAEVGPHPGRLDEHVDALAHHEVVIARGLYVLAESEGDVGVDVVLRRACGVVRRSLLAVDGAPRVERPGVGQLGGPASRGRQHEVAEPQRAAGHLRRGVAEEG